MIIDREFPNATRKYPSQVCALDHVFAAAYSLDSPKDRHSVAVHPSLEENCLPILRCVLDRDRVSIVVYPINLSAQVRLTRTKYTLSPRTSGAWLDRHTKGQVGETQIHGRCAHYYPYAACSNPAQRAPSLKPAALGRLSRPSRARRVHWHLAAHVGTQRRHHCRLARPLTPL